MSKPIYTLDTETDPFKYGRVPEVFAVGLYDGKDFHYEWGEGCLQRIREHLESLPSGIIYVHNGGRFDFYYFLDWFDGKLNIINSRIIKAQGLGHEWRDSVAVYPEQLKSYKKDDIDYRKLEKDVREKHKTEIVSYLKGDCVYLHELVSRIRGEFGDTLTIGSIAMKELKKIHSFDILDSQDDGLLRRKYYYGGRVQCFEKGIIKPKHGGKICCYDINQSYPTSMANYLHPISRPILRFGVPSDSTYFLAVTGYSFGCFPVRDKMGLSFPVGPGTYHVSRYEFDAAIDTGMFQLDKVIECVDFEQASTFNEFVSIWHGKRKDEQLKGDNVWSKFYKRVGNSAYGKFAQCPDNYKEYVIKPLGERPDGDYTEDYVIGDVVLWSKPSEDVTRFNVATGASITGCSRSFLIRALATCKRPLYCDTDSIICEGMGNDTIIHDTQLGAWKLEKQGDILAVAGKKLYALFDGKECVKMASKGVRLTAQQIKSVARGGKVRWEKDAPTFGISGATKFMHRDVRMT